MPVELQIFDGSPWWMSPDIWVVPGDDPDGFPGVPVAGSNAYVWARVHNTGSKAVQNATVRFYWADPSAGFDRTSANEIGTSNVSLSAGQTSDVLCLTPWPVTLVNGGHECVLAEAFHGEDPLPLTPDFNVPTDRHVAQRNLSVLATSASMFSMHFSIHNPSRTERKFHVGLKRGRMEELKPLAKTLGRVKIPTNEGEIESVGFLPERCPSDESIRRAPDEVDVLVRAHGRVALTLVGAVRHGAALIHVVQSSAGVVTGGLSVLVLAQKVPS